MVVEMPRWTNAKYETTKEEKLNPIMQDSKSYGKATNDIAFTAELNFNWLVSILLISSDAER